MDNVPGLNASNGGINRCPKRSRRYLRFGLATALACVSIVAVSLGIVALSARQQMRAVARLAELGGRVAYLDRRGNEIAKDSKPALKWLRKFIGRDYFDRVGEVNLFSTAIVDEDLANLRGFPHATYLHLSRTAITDRGLLYVGGLKQLEHLRLSETDISDAGMTHLSRLACLESIDLCGTQVTDDCIPVLLDLRSLKSVSLIATQITRAGILRMIGAGLKVDCALDVRIEAIAASGEPTTTKAGDNIVIHGTFQVPTGAVSPKNFIVGMSKFSDKYGSVVVGTGIANAVKVSDEQYDFDVTMDLPRALNLPPNSPSVEGAIRLICHGITLAETPFSEIRRRPQRSSQIESE